MRLLSIIAISALPFFSCIQPEESKPQSTKADFQGYWQVISLGQGTDTLWTNVGNIYKIYNDTLYEYAYNNCDTTTSWYDDYGCPFVREDIRLMAWNESRKWYTFDFNEFQVVDGKLRRAGGFTDDLVSWSTRYTGEFPKSNWVNIWPPKCKVDHRYSGF